MKGKTAIRYQLEDMVRPLAIFYLVLYGVVGMILGVSLLGLGEERVGFSGLDMSSMIFLMFCGVYTFQEDFRFFIQNGLTRGMIFKSQNVLFAVLTVCMATFELSVEMLLGGQIEYRSMFRMIYGADHAIFVEWIWRICLYLMIVNGACFATLLQNRIGKRPFILMALALALVAVLLLPAINIVWNGRLAETVFPFLSKLMGVTDSGIHVQNPILTFLGVAAAAMGGSYLLLRRAELK